MQTYALKVDDFSEADWGLLKVIAEIRAYNNKALEMEEEEEKSFVFGRFVIILDAVVVSEGETQSSRWWKT